MAPSNEHPVVAHNGMWTIKWHGGRTADIYHAEFPDQAVECLEVGDYDWGKGEQRWTGSDQQARGMLKRKLGEWDREHGKEYMDNAVRYMR